MIGKLIKGTGARGLLSYLLATQDMNGDTRPRAEIIGGSFAGTNVDQLSQEFGQLRALKPRLKTAIVHESLRLPEGDEIPDDKTWAAIGDEWAKEMGFESYVTICHGDHIHLAASRINPNGAVVSDSHDWKRSEAAVRRIEQKFGLTQVEASHLLEPEKAVDHHRAPDRGMIAMMERGNIPPSAILSEMIDSKIKDGCTASDLIQHLENNGVLIRPNIATTGKISGLSYELDGVEISAKAMGRGFTWSNMIKRGLSYEQDRDLQAIRESGYRAARKSHDGNSASNGASNSANTAVEPIIAKSAGASRETNDAINTSIGFNGSNNQRDDAPNRAAENRKSDIRGDAEIPSQSFARSLPKNAGPESDGSQKGSGKDGNNKRDNSNHVQPGSDLDRLIAIAVSAAKNRPKNALARSSSIIAPELQQHAKNAANMTKNAVIELMNLLTAQTFRVQLVRPNQPNMNLTAQTPDQILKSIDFYKAQNARGADIYLRPEDRRYILVDDIAPDDIARMKNDGFEPVAVLETSKNNFAAWIKVIDSDQPEPTPAEATLIAKAFAKSYNGDPAAADYAHISRMPGFTNRKPKRAINGKAPFVTIKQKTGATAVAGTDLLLNVKRHLEVIARQNAIREASNIITTSNRAGDHIAAYQSAIHRHTQTNVVDWSAADFRAAQDMSLSGWSPEQVAAAITAASPSVAERKGHAAGDYAARTAANAFKSDKVQNELHRRAEEEKARKMREELQRQHDLKNAPRPRF